MSDDGTNIYLPGQQTPLVIENEAQPGSARIIERSWYMFLVGLFNRTGGVAGNAQLPSLDVLGDAQIDGDLNVDGAFTVDGVPLASPVKAWVNFVGATVVINAQLNVASIVRNAAGDYTINFTTPMTDANYTVAISCQANGAISGVGQISTAAAPTVNSVRINTFRSTTETLADYPIVTLSIIGN